MPLEYVACDSHPFARPALSKMLKGRANGYQQEKRAARRCQTCTMHCPRLQGTAERQLRPYVRTACHHRQRALPQRGHLPHLHGRP